MMIRSLVAVSVFISSAVVADTCDPGWRYFPHTQMCYKLLQAKLPWSVAEIRCLYEGGHHTSVSSQEENQFVHEITHHQEAWTGAAFFGADYQYVNSDRSPFGAFEGWEGKNRPKLNRGRRCIKMNSKGEWFQSCCKKLAVTVCEKPNNDYYNTIERS